MVAVAVPCIEECSGSRWLLLLCAVQWIETSRTPVVASCRGQRPCVVNEVGYDHIAWVIGGTELSAGCETLGWELLEHS